MKINRPYGSLAILFVVVSGCAEPTSSTTDATGETASQSSVSDHSVNGDPIELSSEQLAAFTDIDSGNNLPVQPLNGRTIARSK